MLWKPLLCVLSGLILSYYDSIEPTSVFLRNKDFFKIKVFTNELLWTLDKDTDTQNVDTQNVIFPFHGFMTIFECLTEKFPSTVIDSIILKTISIKIFTR